MTDEERDELIHARMRDTDRVPSAPGAYQSARRALAIEQLVAEGII